MVYLAPSAIGLASIMAEIPPGSRCRRATGADDVCRSGAPGSAPTASPDDRGAACAGPRRSVLVVDDDTDVRESVAYLLEDEGYEVHTAAHGRQALALLEKIPCPAVALVDLRMPVMDGVELIAALRGDPRWARLAIVAFSAAATVAPPAGIPFLRKPIGLEKLLVAVSRYSGAG